MYQQTLNKIHDIIAARCETVAESFILANLDLFQSNDYSIIMIPTHDLHKDKQIFDLAVATLQLSLKYPKTRIVILTDDNDRTYFTHARFKHYSGVFRTKRLPQMMDIAKTLNATKVYYASTLINNTLCDIQSPLIIKPSIHIHNADIIYASLYLNNCHDINFAASCTMSQNININSLKRTVNNIRLGHVVLSNMFISGLKCPQITPESYVLRGSLHSAIHDENIAISMGIGVLSQYQYLKIGNGYNLFDYFKICI